MNIVAEGRSASQTQVNKSLVAIQYDARWESQPGIGRFARELRRRLPALTNLPLKGRPTSPIDCMRLGARLWNSTTAFFSPGYNPPLTLPLVPICPFIFTIHDLIFVNYRAEASWAKRRYFQHVVRPAARRAFKVFTVSEFSKREIMAWAGLSADRVEVIYNGVGETFTSVGPRRQGMPYILYVGNQRAHKNVDNLLKALASLAAPYKVDLAITGSATPHTTAVIEQLGLRERVHFLGHLSDEDLATAYRGAIASVMPSHYEGFGLPVIESMACGTPVVCSNVTSLPEVAGDAAVLVEPTAESIASGLTRLLSDPELQEELSKRGIARAADFTWEAAAIKVRAVFDELAGSVVPQAKVEHSARATVI